MEIDRSFETVDEQGNKIKLRFLDPTYEINRLCEIEYKKAWTYCLRNGVATQKKLEQDLKDADIWGEKEEKLFEQLKFQTATAITAMHEAINKKNQEDAKKYALEAASLRQKFEELISLKNTAFSYSCEGTATEVKLEAYIAYATVYDDQPSKKYWKDYKDFITRREERAAIDAQIHYSNILIEDTKDTLKRLPENEFLISNGYFTDDLKLNLKNILTEKKKPRRRKKSDV